MNENNKKKPNTHPIAKLRRKFSKNKMNWNDENTQVFGINDYFVFVSIVFKP